MNNNSQYTMFPFLSDDEVFQYWQEGKQLLQQGIFTHNSDIYYYVEYQNDIRAIRV